jgi:DNA-binding IclR family transcriptional regulator
MARQRNPTEAPPHSAAAPEAAGAEAPRPDGPKLLDKVLRILQLFTVERPEWTASEISRRLAIPLPTAHRIVRSLESHDYLMRVDASYRLGLSAIDLGRRATASLDLRLALRPALKFLARETGETVLLSVYSQRPRGALCIDRVEANHSLRLSLDTGRITPLHAGASSKAILAFSDPDVIEDVLGQALEAQTESTVTDPEKLRDELRLIRKRGWAFSYEENDVGAWGLAIPVLTGDHHLLGVLGVAAPTPRFSAGTKRAFVDALLAAVRDSTTEFATKPPVALPAS